MTFSERIDCLSRSALLFDARGTRLFPADPVAVSIVLASSLALALSR